MSSEIYKPGSYPNLPPPPGTVGVFGWIKNNLFSSISNSTLTIISVVLIYYLIDGIIGWFFFDAVFDANSKIECRKMSCNIKSFYYTVKFELQPIERL